MILAHYNIDTTKIYNILERFYIKYKKRRKFEPNPNGKIPPPFDSIQNVQIYKRTCVYSRENKNEVKEHLVIKIKRYPKPSDYYVLNVLYDDYKDLL
jgi:hypothetical protein